MLRSGFARSSARFCATARLLALVWTASACSSEGSLARDPSAPPGPAREVSSAAPAPAGTAQSSTPGGFELLWQDDFDRFDAARWQLMTHSWDTNLAQFSNENAHVDGGILSLSLTSAPNDASKPFRGVEMRSLETFAYGRIESRARLAPGAGVVSSLVLLYTPWPADDWNELDVEYLGRYSDRVQFNTMVYTGAPVAKPAAQSVTPTQAPELAPLAFDPSADFHVYAIEWTPAAAVFSIDGQVQHTWSSEISRLKLPMNILLTIWASSSADWAGPIGDTKVPVHADYDWVRVYRWTPAE
jgi:endo-1,3-1,4-beta-glycanase ExoK